MKKYIAELIGTFFLVYTIGHTVIGGNPLAPIGIGLVLAAMIYACGHLSGGHFNPAVTLAVWMRGKCETKDVVPYILFQVVGAVLAAVAVSWMRGKAAFNPAVATAAVALNMIKGSQLWAYWVFCMAGGAAAAWVFNKLKADE